MIALAAGAEVRSYVARSWPVLVLHAFLVSAGVVYVLAVVDPNILNGNKIGRGYFLYDSSGYLVTARHTNILAILHAGRAPGAKIPSLGTNGLLYIQGRIAWALCPWSPDVLVFLWNYLMLVWAVRNYRLVARHLGLRLPRWGHVLTFANPLAWFVLVTLTKESWGLLFMSFFALACVRRQWLLLAMAGLLSVLDREYYSAVAAAMGLVAYFRRIRAAWLLVAVAGAYGVLRLAFGDLTGFATIKSSDLGQRSATIMHWMSELQGIPFGHIVAAPVILAFNLSAWINSRQYAAPATAAFVHAATVSSLLFCVLIVAGALRYRRVAETREGVRLLGRLLFAFAVLDTLYPLSQHRYLLPAWPLLVLWAVAHPARSGGAPLLESLDQHRVEIPGIARTNR